MSFFFRHLPVPKRESSRQFDLPMDFVNRRHLSIRPTMKNYQNTFQHFYRRGVGMSIKICFLLCVCSALGIAYALTLPAKKDLREMITDQTDVSLSMTMNVLAELGKEKNIVFSPLSIHVVLSLLASGSSGAALDQLLSFLNHKSTDQLNSLSSQLLDVVFDDGSPIGGPRLSFANSLWLEKTLPLKESFKQVANSTYKAPLIQVDFKNKAAEVLSQVNAWAEKETNGLIKELLPSDSVDSTARLIFANALYFKGVWEQKFYSSDTEEGDFHLPGGSSVKVPFLTTKKKQVVSAFDGFKVLGIPYEIGADGRRFSMYFFLPDAKDGLPALTDKMRSGTEFLERHLPYDEVNVGDFKLPKFKISFGLETSQTLRDLGVVLPFSEGGLTEMAEGQHLFVSAIFHKSFIEVDEEGTEAAAVSAAVMVGSSLVETTIDYLDFVADHPFLFIIRENMTGIVIFIGHVLNPLKE